MKDLTKLRKTRKEKQRRADDLFTWRVIGVMLFITLWTFLLYHFDLHAVLYAVPAGAAVIYLLAYIYPRDFTALTLIVSGGALGFWLITMQYPAVWSAVALFGAVIALFSFLLWKVRKNKGILKLGKNTITIIPRRGIYHFLYIACAALALGLAATAVFGGTAALVSMIALLCYLFIAAVFYTVRLM
jgi:hypothetical protein